MNVEPLPITAWTLGCLAYVDADNGADYAPAFIIQTVYKIEPFTNHEAFEALVAAEIRGLSHP